MASRISRKVCTLGRPGALGTGRWGSIQDHSASDKSVWYALLMLGTLPSHLLKAPFRTVSPRTRLNRGAMRKCLTLTNSAEQWSKPERERPEKVPTAFLEKGEPLRERSPQHSVSTKGLGPCASQPG